MIVCVCNNVSEKKIHHAVASGLSTMAELRQHLEVGTCCGKCAGCARKILRERVAEAAHDEMLGVIRQLHFPRTPLVA